MLYVRRLQVNAQIVDDVVHVVSAEQEPVEVVQVVLVDVLPDAPHFLPHVEVAFSSAVRYFDGRNRQIFLCE